MKRGWKRGPAGDKGAAIWGRARSTEKVQVSMINEIIFNGQVNLGERRERPLMGFRSPILGEGECLELAEIAWKI